MYFGSRKKHTTLLEAVMKKYFLMSVAVLVIALTVFAQEEEILPAQAEAIRSLAIEKGFTPQTLNDYLVQKWGAPLNKLSRRNASALIGMFQSATPPSPSDVRQEAAPILSPAAAPTQTQQQIAPLPQQRTVQERQAPLLIAEYLEVGMSKRFHIVDGNIIQGTIVKIEAGVCDIETSDGMLKIPTKDILEETAEITKRDGSRYVGPVLKETMEEITLRSKYGDVAVSKKDIQDMNRYHGGKLVPWAEEKKTFYRGDVVLTDIFFDPTAFPLDPNTLYISALSLGYGFTDNFMVRTSFGNNFSGDLNLQPLFQLYSKRTGTNRMAAAIGVDMYSHHDMTAVIAKYARYIKENTTGKSINEISSIPQPSAPDKPFSISDALAQSYKSTFYSEIYFVLSQRWSLESGRGEMGYHVGFRTNTLPFYRKAVLADGFDWTNDAIGKVPFRFWAAFEYDLTKNLKLAANVWADNGYRYRKLDEVMKDYFKETPFILDGLEGEYRTVDFDFGLLYAVNNSLRIGIHFKDPYLELFWRILEF
jgi:hypothetical protein